MKTYIGTKIIQAEPMTRAEYNAYRNWALPENEDGTDEGYLVEYTDGGKANDSRHVGYISWSPKAQFDNAYRETPGLTFGLAIEALKKGAKVARAGWNGKGMFLWIPEPLAEFGTKVFVCCDDEYTASPWIGMKTADNKFVPWLASQTDMLAEDWQVLP